MNELEKAIKTVKAAGYSVIKAESIQTLGSQTSVSMREFLKFGDKPEFIRTIRGRLYSQMADVLFRDGLCKLSSRPINEIEPDTKIYTAHLTVLPYQIEHDPILDFMREDQKRSEKFKVSE